MNQHDTSPRFDVATWHFFVLFSTSFDINLGTMMELDQQLLILLQCSTDQLHVTVLVGQAAGPFLEIADSFIHHPQHLAR